mmetsp:Transcript_48774/g.87845  ORF Transcript_48774/g.87845 Transcript_48774/m.87845 type:complete len:130 (-) Transcript_48774:43-432(-)
MRSFVGCYLFFVCLVVAFSLQGCFWLIWDADDPCHEMGPLGKVACRECLEDEEAASYCQAAGQLADSEPSLVLSDAPISIEEKHSSLLEDEKAKPAKRKRRKVRTRRGRKRRQRKNKSKNATAAAPAEV